MSQFIAEFTTPIDPGGGSPGRQYQSPPIVGDWTNLWATFTANTGWSGAFVLSNEGSAYWFNRFPQPVSPFTEFDPNPTTIHSGDKMYVSTNNGSAGLMVTVDLFGDPPGTTVSGVCQYGTRTQTQFRGLSIGAATLVTLISNYYGLGWIGSVFDGLVGIAVSTDVLCQGPPPLMPNITAQDLMPGPAGQPPKANFDTVLQVYESLLWPRVCECVPGSPSPTPASDPTLVIPPNIPTLLTLPDCDEGSICNILQRLMYMMAQLDQQINMTLQQVNLIQRVSVPFAYVPGTRHFALSGQGTISVPSLVGLVVEVTSLPGYLTSDMETPPSSYRFGDLSFGTADGWESKVKIVHNPHLILDVNPAVTTVGYTFESNVVANILELVREP